MNETAILPQHAGIDRHVSERAILATHARFAIAHALARPQATQDVVNHLAVDVKLGDVMSDVLIDGISEQIQFGAVGAQYRAVGCDPMQADRRILEKVRQLLLAAP
ncbi:MAG: hypothetical protein Q8N52_08235, partial [Acidobacteriota bacterium]|nr:hypothetical protein [Acidobacteriota bacterium]